MGNYGVDIVRTSVMSHQGDLVSYTKKRSAKRVHVAFPVFYVVFEKEMVNDEYHDCSSAYVHTQAMLNKGTKSKSAQKVLLD